MYRTVAGHWYREKWRLIKSSSVETGLLTDTVAYMSIIFSNHSVFFFCFTSALSDDDWPADSADFPGLSWSLTPISSTSFLLRPPADPALDFLLKRQFSPLNS